MFYREIGKKTALYPIRVFSITNVYLLAQQTKMFGKIVNKPSSRGTYLCTPSFRLFCDLFADEFDLFAELFVEFMLKCKRN